ncbi:uncharacterized protein LOC127633465 isoform X3 [Xyrauchen texanus]|uniref:uncharacterized protein LOC127633465 isoform X3 n=1 Tax=Xyrauchen texanus TaxID=154827 RepID=UPI002241F28D|nr:uncharacterized protein LOC127633465 isoform X3 [Xyrauchen texanus]
MLYESERTYKPAFCSVLLHSVYLFVQEQFSGCLHQSALQLKSSSSDSSGISSPEQMAGASSIIQGTDQRRLHVSQGSCSPLAPIQSAEDPAISLRQNNVSYDNINRVLREAHFNSLQSRGQQGPT